MLWHEQSWPKMAEVDKNLPVVVPLGSCEQHGRHLPLFVDSLQVEAVASRVEQQMGPRALLAPTLWLGASHHHLDFPGTISLRPTIYAQMIQEVTRCILKAGFRRIFFLNGHGGNETPGSQALVDLIATDDLADSAHLALASWWKIAAEGLEPKRHAMTTAGVSHACEYETSLMLMLRPDLVDMDQVVEGEPVLDDRWYHPENHSRVSVYRRFHRLSSAGSMGCPSAATAAKGESIIEAVVSEVVEFIDAFAGWPDLPVIKK